eukprot:TRINITY_DN14128_c0_g1_i1.p1 TRINITY_DN14128_c0_g1~~TRINITY_DN14128_c0_g1_i1.p1  ORF type:complete len:157 (+),score=35.91 TRINITY_DN14128_c0_g1_i1:97-567(+)
MIRRPPRSTQGVSSAASDVYKRQGINAEYMGLPPDSSDCFCQYTLPFPSSTFITQKVKGINTDPDFNYDQDHSYDYMSEGKIKFFEEFAIQVKLFGYTKKVVKGKKYNPSAIKRKKVLTEVDRCDKSECCKMLQSCLLYTSPSPRDLSTSRMPSSA